MKARRLNKYFISIIHFEYMNGRYIYPRICKRDCNYGAVDLHARPRFYYQYGATHSLNLQFDARKGEELKMSEPPLLDWGKAHVYLELSFHLWNFFFNLISFTCSAGLSPTRDN